MIKGTNKIEIRKTTIPSGYETEVFFIDDKPLYEYMNEWLSSKPDLMKSLFPTDDLALAWTDGYDFEGDARFMRFVLQQENAVTPILSCPDDFDFSCIVIVADVVKKEDKVYWRRIGKIDHSGESFEDERRSGILYTGSYTDQDWERYGDNIAKEDVDSPKWHEWISENWSEELFRRRVNYTFPYYQNEKKRRMVF